MRFFLICVASIFLLVSVGGQAGEAASVAVVADKTSDKTSDEALEKIRASLKALDPTIPIESIVETPLVGIYEVVLSSSNILYASADGKYLFQGDMLKLEDGKVDNLANSTRTKIVKVKLANIPKDQMIIFAPKGETKAVIYAFTDVDCGYCRKLHAEVGEFNKLGIELRYLAFPRGGKRAPAYNKMVSAWCADDRKKAMTVLKRGESIPEKNCSNPVDEHFQLGNDLGIRGTPAIFLEDGTAIPGYRSATDIAQILGLLPVAKVAKTKTKSK